MNETAKTSQDILESLKLMADAITTNNRAANRLWLFAAFVTAIIVGTTSDDAGLAKFIGIEMDAKTLYLVAAFVLAFVNLAYCSARMQAIRASEIFSKRIEEVDGGNVEYTTGVKLATAAHTLPMPDFVRIYPLLHDLPYMARSLIFFPLKFIMDTISLGLPLLGLWVAYMNANDGQPGYSNQVMMAFSKEVLDWIPSALSAFSAASAVASAYLLVAQLKWTLSRKIPK